MPNEFASTTNSQGLLKDYYGEPNPVQSPISEALKKKRRKLYETKTGDKVVDEDDIKGKQL